MVHNLRVVHRRLDIGLSSTRRCSNDLLFAATVPLSRSTQSLDHSPAFDAASPKRSRSSRLYLHATPLHQPTGDPNLHVMRKLDLGPPSTRRCTSNYFLQPNCHTNDSLFFATVPLHTIVHLPLTLPHHQRSLEQRLTATVCSPTAIRTIYCSWHSSHTSVACPALNLRRCNNSASSNITLLETQPTSPSSSSWTSGLPGGLYVATQQYTHILSVNNTMHFFAVNNI